jgi:hypothetical protein
VNRVYVLVQTMMVCSQSWNLADREFAAELSIAKSELFSSALLTD